MNQALENLGTIATTIVILVLIATVGRLRQRVDDLEVSVYDHHDDGRIS